MALDKDSMKTKIADAILANKGITITEGDANVLLEICQGIIEEILANAVVTGTVTSGSGAGGNVTGTIT